MEIAAIAREAGHRTKIAVSSHQPGVNAKGACIGPMGSRVRNVMAELHGEKIDIVDWSEDPAEFVAQRAVPGPGARGSRWWTPQARVARVIVPDYQLSLAIGKEGQNARLAARLTGWRIDIRPDTQRPGRRPGDAAGRSPARRSRSAWQARPDGRGAADAADDDVSLRGNGQAVPATVRPRLRSTCVGCRVRAAKSDLLRLVAVGDDIVPDPRRGCPAGVRICIPARNASSWHSAAGRSRGRCALPGPARVPGGLRRAILAGVRVLSGPAVRRSEQNGSSAGKAGSDS